MSELCKKCSKFYHAESKQDEEGCSFTYPMKDCPKIKNILKLSKKWRVDDGTRTSGKYFVRCACADELDEEIRREC